MWAQVPEIEKNSSVHESYRRIKVKFLLHFLIFSSCLKSLIISYYKDKSDRELLDLCDYLMYLNSYDNLPMKNRITL